VPTLNVVVGTFLFLAGGVGCGSSERDDEDGGDSRECNIIEVCNGVPAADVSSSCGVTVTSTSSTVTTSADPSRLPLVSTCSYAGMPLVQVEHRCYSSPSLASSTFANERRNVTSNDMQTDVSGIGDQAFRRENSAYMTTMLFVLQSNVVVVITGNALGGGGQVTDECLQTLARGAADIR
jgi:hypothetical protein